MPQSLKQPFRGYVYAALQNLRGRPLQRFIEQAQELERLPASELAELHEQRLRSTLTHARRTVPLYRTGAWQAALADGSEDLSVWPVLEREVLRERNRELRAQPAPPRIVTRRTSGSTGAPVKIAFTSHADTWGWAHRYQGLQWHGIPIGIPTLRLSADRRPLRDMVLGNYSVPALDVPGAIDRAVRILLDKRPPLVTGPPTALFYLARCLRQRGVTAPPAAFARAGGEQLFAFQRTAIEQYLGARVVDSYGCTEIGALAGECPAGARHIYSDHVHLEIFDGNAPAAPGAFGDIVATALQNPAMPLIRYRTGDRGRLSLDQCSCGLSYPVLLELQARAADEFRAPDGSLLHGSLLVAQLAGFFADPQADRVRQVQFCQINPLSWRALVEVPGAAGGQAPGALHDRLAGMVHHVFGAQCRVETQLVDTIPRHRGKLRYYSHTEPVARTGTLGRHELRMETRT